MKPQENNSSPKTNSRFSRLARLGWNSFFQEQLADKEEEISVARVTGVRKNICLVNRGDKDELANLAGRLFHEPGAMFPAVGDWVFLRENLITSVFIRKNALVRKASGGRDSKDGQARSEDQVLAANLDMVFIVCGMDRDFNPRRIERYLTLVYNCNITPVVVLTKADLHPDPDSLVSEVENVAFGVPVFPVSADDDNSISQLSHLFSQAETAALIGSSGAGKSTLINRLSGAQLRSTASVGDKVGKGRHTTTTRDLLLLPAGGIVIDNPGIREISLASDSDLSGSAFPDIEEQARLCRFGNCSHTHEPGCKVQEAVSSGLISPGRLLNYQKLKRELKYHRQLETEGAARAERERWKGVSLKVKAIKKRKR